MPKRENASCKIHRNILQHSMLIIRYMMISFRTLSVIYLTSENLTQLLVVVGVWINENTPELTKTLYQEGGQCFSPYINSKRTSRIYYFNAWFWLINSSNSSLSWSLWTFSWIHILGHWLEIYIERNYYEYSYFRTWDC